MSKLEILQTEYNTLLEMSDEVYNNTSYFNTLSSNYSFFELNCSMLGSEIHNVNRGLAIMIIKQAIIIYSVSIY